MRQKNENRGSALFLYGRTRGGIDGVRDYGYFLGNVLTARGWRITDSSFSHPAFWHKLRHANPEWVILHYTALSWSQRGIAIPALRLIRKIQTSGHLAAVVFHDVEGHPGNQILYRARRFVQHILMRQMVRQSDIAISTVPPSVLEWPTPKMRAAMIAIPVGPNILPGHGKNKPAKRKNAGGNVVVFGMSSGDTGKQEQEYLVSVLEHASKRTGNITVNLVGKGCDHLHRDIERRMRIADIRFHAHGICSPEKVSEILSSGDCMLFPRGGVRSNRGTVIAGIAHGLPVIAPESPHYTHPLTAAGIITSPLTNTAMAADHLATVLSDHKTHERLACRSRNAYEQWFSWERIAERFDAILHAQSSAPPAFRRMS